ncbi:tRNA adenosine deaminase-associated protein [Corynebacterium matruchotii]|uniref:tRNA adenosine deaminase-associated protein n=1 Tax=Corynebacterium matruchotii TaxID=43768 RepID=UPI0028EFE27C|nr:tRNA adenosine deaminase-associated protein [Corynebacterium matruchotii]
MERNFAVTVARLGSSWEVGTFHDDFSTVDTAVGAVRSLRAESAAFALLCVDDEYFVIVRPTPSGVRLFLSDASMGAVDDFAASILEELDVEVPDIAEEDFADTEGWPEGDFDILVDVGLSEQVLSVIVDESEWWASEQLQRIAEELGFDDALAKAVG